MSLPISRLLLNRNENANWSVHPIIATKNTHYLLLWSTPLPPTQSKLIPPPPTRLNICCANVAKQKKIWKVFPCSLILTLNVHFFTHFQFQMSMFLCKIFNRESIFWNGVLLPTHYLLQIFQCHFQHKLFTTKLPRTQTMVNIFFVNKWFYFYHENKAESFSSINFSKKAFNIFDPKVVLIKLNEIIRNILWFRCKLKANKNTNSFILDNETFPIGKFWFIYFCYNAVS